MNSAIGRTAGRVVVLGMLTFAPVVAARAAAQATAEAPAAGPGPEGLVPAGFGTLNQSDIEIRLTTDELEIRFVPLDERITRLLANDAYQALHGLVRARRADIEAILSRSGVSRPGLALVSFFGHRQGARFEPQTLTLSVRNQVFRPIGIVPLSSQFTSQQLDVRGAATGLYVYEQEIPVTDDFNVEYNGLRSDDWSKRLTTFDRERQRIQARARNADTTGAR
jgi:hypothetical protein